MTTLIMTEFNSAVVSGSSSGYYAAIFRHPLDVVMTEFNSALVLGSSSGYYTAIFRYPVDKFPCLAIGSGCAYMFFETAS